MSEPPEPPIAEVGRVACRAPVADPVRKYRRRPGRLGVSSDEDAVERAATEGGTGTAVTARRTGDRRPGPASRRAGPGGVGRAAARPRTIVRTPTAAGF